MGRLFGWISKWIAKKPVKILLATTLIFVIMISGALNIQMATGNETLVKTDTEAYQSNLKMEKGFGGESILVLFEGNKDDLLSINNINSMWNVQQEMHYDENIFSFISPASIVNKIAEQQSDVIKDKVIEISGGLEEMSVKMKDIGEELASKDIKDPNEIRQKLDSLSESTDAFDKLIQTQNNMKVGNAQIETNLTKISTGLDQVSLQLNQMSRGVEQNPELSTQLQMISGKIQQSAKGLTSIADNTGKFEQGNQQTSQALTQMKNKLASETEEMKAGLTDGLTPEQVTEMADGFITMSDNLMDISEGLHTFYDKSGMMIADIPTTEENLNEILYDEGELRSIFNQVIVDNSHALMVVKLDGNLEDSQKDAVYQKLDKTLHKQTFNSIDYTITGKPVLDSSLRAEMQTNMQEMVGLAVGIMLLILMIIFKVRWRILPLLIVFIAVIATLGIMGSVGIPMTMVSMAVFPILIGLGIDYSIQFQSRYEEEKSMKITLQQMGPAVGIAVFATMLGFIALYVSPVPMVQDFGKMLTIGVAISYIAGIFLLMTILYIRDRFFPVKEKRRAKKKIKKGSFLENSLSKMTGKMIKGSFIILLVAILLTSWGVWADDKVGVQTDIEKFMPQDTQALKDIHELRDVLGSTDQLVIYLEDEDVLSKDNLTWIDHKTTEIEEKYPNMVVESKSITTLARNIGDSESISYEGLMGTIQDIPDEQRKLFVNEDTNKAIISLSIKHVPVEELKGFIKDLQSEVKDTNMKANITGKSVIDVEMVKGLTSGRNEMTLLGMGLIFVGLLFIYRNPIKALIPVLPISFIVGLSSGIMYLLGLKYTPLTATLGALILGIGTEMTILLLERYIEERKQGKKKIEAIQTAVSKIGSAIIASGVTTIGGFSVLIISDFVILQDFGLMTVINLTLALLSTLIVLPPVIYLLDRWIIREKNPSKAIAVESR